MFDFWSGFHISSEGLLYLLHWSRRLLEMRGNTVSHRSYKKPLFIQTGGYQGEITESKNNLSIIVFLHASSHARSFPVLRLKSLTETVFNLTVHSYNYFQIDSANLA